MLKANFVPLLMLSFLCLTSYKWLWVTELMAPLTFGAYVLIGYNITSTNTNAEFEDMLNFIISKLAYFIYWICLGILNLDQVNHIIPRLSLQLGFQFYYIF